MSVRLDKCVTFEESPDDGIYMRRLTPADVVELARSLEGASEEWVCFLDGGYGDRCRRPEDIDRNDPLDIQWHGNCGRYLVIPLPEEEEKR